MTNSRSVEEILKEIRATYLEEKRDAARSSGAGRNVVVPLRESKSTWSTEEPRWHNEDLIMVWPSSSAIGETESG